MSTCDEGYYQSGNKCLPCSEFCGVCEESEKCLACISDRYYFLEETQKCIDCKDPKNKPLCFYLEQTTYYIDIQYNIIIRLLFNRNFRAADNITAQDISLAFSDPATFEASQLVDSRGNQLTMSAKILKSFVLEK